MSRCRYGPARAVRGSLSRVWGVGLVPLCRVYRGRLLILSRRWCRGPVRSALLFSHDGVGREFIHALKYRGERAIARWLGDSLALAHLAAAGEGAQSGPGPVELVTWAPTTAAHRRSRGFDQAEVLARAAGKALRVRPRGFLRRVGAAVQTGAGRAERLAGPRFVARAGVAGRRVLLVDDVLTTGATLRSAAATLLDAGAASVHVAACARRGYDSSAPDA